MPNPYATAEPAESLWLERWTFVSVYLGTIGYGISIAAVSTCCYYLIRQKKKNNWKWLLFVLLLFALASLNIGINMAFNQWVYVDNRNYPGGPLAYLSEQQGLPVNIFGNAESIALSLIAAVLLIYRCYKVYDKWWILPVPILSLLGATAMGILTVVQASLPHSSLWANGTLSFSVPYFGLICALNVLLTLVIVGRLLYMQHKISKALGPQHGRIYSNISTILIESATPYAIISLIIVILYGSGKTSANLFVPLFVQMECISPTLIILRVAQGKAWSSEMMTETHLTNIRFNGKATSDGSTTARGFESNRFGGSGKNASSEALSMIVFKPSGNQAATFTSEV